MATAGNEIRLFYTVFDQNKDPLTGMTSPADVALALFRESGATFIAAVETVVWAETAIAGRYVIRFTPANTGSYVLELEELNALTFQSTNRWDLQVFSAGGIFLPSLSNAFCSESDIERWLQLSLTGSSKPTSDEAAAFAEGRAADLMGALGRVGYSITPSSVPPGSVIEDLLREANAIGGAGDAIIAKFMGVEPSRVEKGAALLDEYDVRKKALVAFAEATLVTGKIHTPATSGEVTPKSESVITDAGLSVGISMEDRF